MLRAYVYVCSAFARGFYEALRCGKSFPAAFDWGTARVEQEVPYETLVQSAFPELLQPREGAERVTPSGEAVPWYGQRALQAYSTLDTQRETRRRRTVQLRRYQQELVERIVGAEAEPRRRNAIVYLPTGSGKTMVAARIVEESVRRSPGKFAIFMVNTIPLVFQQAKVFDEFTELRVGHYCGEMSMFNWKEELETKQLVVITAGLLQNLLNERQLSLEDCCILVCDEVHHATKGHPFNQVLKDHFFTCTTEDQPHFLGLTASPGGEITEEDTRKRIVDLCLNTKAEVTTPQEHADELAAHVNHADVEFVQVPRESDDRGFDVIIEDFIGKLADILNKDSFPFKLGAFRTSDPQEFGTIDLPQAESASCGNEAWSFMVSTIRECYDAYFEWRESGHAAAYLAVQSTLKDLAKGWPEDSTSPSLSKDLHSLLQDRQLKQIMEDDTSGLKDFSSGKAARLVKYLQEICGGDGDGDGNDKRVLVFVTRRRTADALCSRIEKSAELSAHWRPGVLTGHGTSVAQDGMTWKEQTEAVERFNSGEVNLLLATSVAEEGLDIQACNYVIRLDAATTVEAMVQSRGRARHRDSHFVVFYENQGEQTSMAALQEKEKMMQQTVARLMGGQLKIERDRIDLQVLHTAGQRKFKESDAIEMLRQVCENENEHADYRTAHVGTGLVRKWQVTVQLPMGYQLPIEHTGELRQSEQAAKDTAAYEVCVRLHAYGLLDGYLGTNFVLDSSPPVDISAEGMSPPRKDVVMELNELCQPRGWVPTFVELSSLGEQRFQFEVSVVGSGREMAVRGEVQSSRKAAKKSAVAAWLGQQAVQDSRVAATDRVKAMSAVASAPAAEELRSKDVTMELNELCQRNGWNPPQVTYTADQLNEQVFQASVTVEQCVAVSTAVMGEAVRGKKNAKKAAVAAWLRAFQGGQATAAEAVPRSEAAEAVPPEPGPETAPEEMEVARPVSEWGVGALSSWLRDEMHLEDVAQQAVSNDVNGATALEMEKAEWQELGASGLQAAKVVGALKKKLRE